MIVRGSRLSALRFRGGPDVTVFEQEFEAFCGLLHAVGVPNRTDALTIALWRWRR